MQNITYTLHIHINDIITVTLSQKENKTANKQLVTIKLIHTIY